MKKRHIFGFDFDGCVGGHGDQKTTRTVKSVVERNRNLWAWVRSVIGDTVGASYLNASTRNSFHTEAWNEETKGPAFGIYNALGAELHALEQLALRFDPYLFPDTVSGKLTTNGLLERPRITPGAKTAGSTFALIREITNDFAVSCGYVAGNVMATSGSETTHVTDLMHRIEQRHYFGDQGKILLLLSIFHHLNEERAEDEVVHFHFVDDMYGYKTFQFFMLHPELIPRGIVAHFVTYDADFPLNASSIEIQRYRGFEVRQEGAVTGNASLTTSLHWKEILLETVSELNRRELFPEHPLLHPGDAAQHKQPLPYQKLLNEIFDLATQKIFAQSRHTGQQSPVPHRAIHGPRFPHALYAPSLPSIEEIEESRDNAAAAAGPASPTEATEEPLSLRALA